MINYNREFHERARRLQEATKNQHCQICDKWTDGKCLHEGK
jgi:hypothetical protein